MITLLLAMGFLGAAAAAAADPPHVPFTVRANKVLLPVTVADSRVLQVILDTGMQWEGLLLYNSALLDSLDMPGAIEARVGGAGSGAAQTAVMADSLSMRLGDVALRNQRIVVLRGDSMKGFSTDGVIGYSLFNRYAVELDYERMELILHDPGGFQPDTSWVELPLSFPSNVIPWIEVTTSISDADSALAGYIDLASSESVEFLTCEGMRFTLPDSLEDVYLGRGLSGDIQGARGRVAWVRLGPYCVDDVIAAFTPAEVRSKQPGADLVIGNGLLRRFHCVFDYGTRRLWLRKAP
jgi:hypothetical protein